MLPRKLVVHWWTLECGFGCSHRPHLGVPCVDGPLLEIPWSLASLHCYLWVVRPASESQGPIILPSCPPLPPHTFKLILKREEGGEKERETSPWETHQSVASHPLQDIESNPQSFGARDDVPTTDQLGEWPEMLFCKCKARETFMKISNCLESKPNEGYIS